MASTSSQPSTSSTTHPCPPQWVHDVFLNFRGPNTRNNFTAHLYSALAQRGIKVYKDDRELERGSIIGPELWKVIEESMLSIVIFSKDYASSPWCLDELVKIICCWKTKGQKVLPIFYDVDPTKDVANQKGSYEEAFVRYEEEFKYNKEKVKMWKDALSDVANLSGWVVQNKDESEIINEIVNEVWREVSQTLSIADKGLVGMDFHLKEMNNLLQEDQLMDVRFIGICGMGGVGKTTIATVVYDWIGWQFELCCFLSNVKEAFKSHDGAVLLQKQILSKLHGKHDIMSLDARSGAAEIHKCLKNKRILIILDDVDDLEQLKLLAGERSWFGPGSRVIITSQDSHFLSTHGVDAIYNVDMLNKHDSLVLFSHKSFGQEQPPEEFFALSKRVLDHANGLPLALSVFGSFLRGRSMIMWQNAIDSLYDFSNEIMDVLRISFDNLEKSQKQIFLDIACFFNGKDKEWVINILDECGFHAHIGIEVLIEKSLLSVFEKKLHMHELLQVMGRHIVNEECPNAPGRRSRLWDPKEIHHVFENNTGNEAVEAIVFDKILLETKLWNMEAFSKMTKLRIFSYEGVPCEAGPTYLSSELRYLYWFYYPSKSLPFSFQPNRLVELHLESSEIKQLWPGHKVLNCLKTLNLSSCKNLVKTPDFIGIPNLEILILNHCTNLPRLHPSFQHLKKLVELHLYDCINLKELTSSIEIKSLKILDLRSCWKLKKFPTIGGAMPHIYSLRLSSSKLKTLPDSIHNLIGLVSLQLQFCEKLQNLPTSITQLKSLKELDLMCCSNLKELPEDICQLESLEFLNLRKTGIRYLPKSTFSLRNLKELELGDIYSSPTRLKLNIESMEELEVLVLPPLAGMLCLQVLKLDHCNLGEGSIPDDISCLSMLTILSLRGNNFVSLPRTISQLSMLLELYLEDCRMLRSLPEIPPNVELLSINGCVALEEVPDPMKLESPNDSIFQCFHCKKLYEKNGGDHISSKMIQQYIKGLSNPKPGFSIIIPGRKIPKWFTNQSEGWSITVPILRDFLDANSVSKWIGLAACVSFRGGREALNKGWCTIYFTIDNNELVELDHEPSINIPRCNGSAKSDHLWSFFLSIHQLKIKDMPISHLTLSFRFLSGRGRCGVRLVSSEDIVDDDRESMTEDGSNTFGDDDIGSSEDDERPDFLTRMRRLLSCQS